MPRISRIRFLSFLVMAFCSSIISNAQNLQNITVYIQNPTTSTINYSYKRGGDDWAKKSLQPGYTVTLKGIAPHSIRFDNGKKTVRSYNMNAGTYYFFWKNGVLDVSRR